MDATTYTLARGAQRYGPYTLEQLREYVSQGSVQPADLVWCAGMTTWSPVSTVLGTMAEPGTAAPPPIPGSPLSPSPLPQMGPSHPMATSPKPPALHWAIVLLLSVVTCGVFMLVWMFLQALWIRRIDPANNALIVLAVGVPLQFILSIASAVSNDGEGLLILSYLVGFVATQVAFFSMREVMQNRFLLQLSGIMTFFFNVLYLQFHMTRIANGEVQARP